MPNSPAHPTSSILEQLAEGTLSRDERASAEAHLAACDRCAAEVQSYRALFRALEGLPHFTPSVSFADGVMNRVRIVAQPDPLYARVRRWLPKSRRGWTFLCAAIVTPALPMIALVAWVLSHPLVTPAGLWQWATDQAGTAGQGLVGQAVNAAAAYGLTEWGQAFVRAISVVPLGIFVAIMVTLSIAIPLSAWLLVRLVRVPMGDVNYAR